MMVSACATCHPPCQGARCMRTPGDGAATQLSLFHARACLPLASQATAPPCSIAGLYVI